MPDVGERWRGVTIWNLDLGQTIVRSKIVSQSALLEDMKWIFIPSGSWTHHSWPFRMWGVWDPFIFSCEKALSLYGNGQNSVNSKLQNWIGFASECKLLNFPSLMGDLTGTKKNAVSGNYHPFDFLTWFQGNLWLQFLINAIGRAYITVM